MEDPFFLPSFRSKRLWQQAMTHRSFVNEQPNVGEHNERLEFLGDAILTFLSGNYLYARYPDRSEGELTPIRAALVDQPQLCHFAKKLSLNEHLLLGKGAEQEGSRRSARLLCSAFEALIGAYFLDTDRDIEAVRRYVVPMFDTVVEQAVAQDINPKSRLQEWAQQRFDGETPCYQVVSSSGPDHVKTFVVEVSVGGKPCGQGQGSKIVEAEKAAARAALTQLSQ